MKLSDEVRDKLPASDFAVPAKRALPIHDATHVKLAWDMVDRTHELTDADRSAARKRIMERAKALGLDTAGWKTVRAEAIDLQAMSLDMPVTPDHPNKHPFSGIMTRIDEPSDAAPHGSGGRLVMVTRAAAEAALPTLLGMGIDCSENLTAHAPSHKIGIITAANIVGNAVEIEGYFFAKDFPNEMRLIMANKSRLGFSFELTPTEHVISAGDVFQVNEGVFTGAALLYRDKAAYRSTSLAAATSKEPQMDPIEELKGQVAELAGQVKTLSATSETLTKENAALKTQLEANAAVMGKVEPHAAALESCAAGMEAAGIGADPKHGHVVALKRMAGNLRASAALGKMPAIYRDHDYTDFSAAAAQPDPETTKKIEKLEGDLAAANTKITDLTEKAKANSGAPERKTISASVNDLLARRGIKVGEGEEAPSGATIDAALAATNMTPLERIKFKRQIERASETAAA